MMELSFAYLVAAGLIASLILLSKKNQKEGWRKQRNTWGQAQVAAAIRAFEAKSPVPAAGDPLKHIGDLERLRQALATDGTPQTPDPVEQPQVVVQKTDELAQTR